jgi:hypothetical protein
MPTPQLMAAALIHTTEEVFMPPTEPNDPPAPVPPGKPWIDPTSPENSPGQPSDPRKPWIAPTEPGEHPSGPSEPQPPFVE